MGFVPPSSLGILGALGALEQPSSAFAFASEINRKAAWETKFSRWRSPPSETEAQKIERTERMIRSAIDADTYLSSLDLQIIVQGSYSNNTNVRGESDVDICVLMRDIYNYHTANAYPGAYHYHGISHIPPTITPASFKNALHQALVAKFDAGTVQRGGKCIKIRSNSARVDADVVAANIYRLYVPGANQPVTALTPTIEGIAIHPDQGAMIVNWPLQHGANGRAKNTRTGGRFKAVVRILKSLNLEMAGTNYKPLQSFLIECLVYNCPDHCFVGDKLYENVQSALTHISFLQGLLGNSSSWLEVNEIKLLFGSHQPWELADVQRFVAHAQRRLAGAT